MHDYLNNSNQLAKLKRQHGLYVDNGAVSGYIFIRKFKNELKDYLKDYSIIQICNKFKCGGSKAMYLQLAEILIDSKVEKLRTILKEDGMEYCIIYLCSPKAYIDRKELDKKQLLP